MEVRWAYNKNQLAQILDTHDNVIDVKPIITGVTYVQSVYSSNKKYENNITYMVLLKTVGGIID